MAGTNRPKAAIAIPVYSSLTESEKEFVELVRQVFSERAIFFVSPSSFCPVSDTIEKVIHFEPNFFKDKYSYSELLCSKEFYSAFSDFDFLQIVQLDCWVFEDRLDEFMNLGFDIIGAPWMKNSFEGKPEPELWKVGNGGFSLRNVRSFLSIIDQIHHTEKGKQPVFKNSNKGVFDKLKAKGFRNNLSHYIKNPPGEDIFWTHYVPRVFSEKEFKISDAITGAHYSFEVLPEFLYNEITSKTLPMGCHAWRTHSPQFWEEFIPA